MESRNCLPVGSETSECSLSLKLIVIVHTTELP